MNNHTSSSSLSTRILIVDDHPGVATTLARVLGSFDTPVDIVTARSGEEALEVTGNRKVDILITDFLMPGMNGLDLVEKLRKNHEPEHIILITAYDMPGLDVTARQLNVTDYFVKPINPSKIRAAVGQVLQDLNNRRARRTGTSRKFKILVADDRPDNLRLLIVRLENQGYEIMTSSDGEETLQQLRTGLPDLVLLDVNMPKMNGFEVLAEMRADPEIAHIPVIILSAVRTFTHDVQEGLNLGADDYVIKPFDWRELLARIRAKLRIKQIEDVLRRRNRELSLLPQIGQDLTAPLSVGELAQVVLDRTVPALEATNGHLVIFHTDGNVSHRMYKLRDFNPWTWQKTQRRIVNEGLISYVVATGQGATTENTREDPRWVKTPNDPVRSAISVPLLNRRGVIGVLTLNHHKVGYFNDEHLTLLQALASQAAIAIENAQFHEIEQKRTKDLVALNKLTHSLTLFTRLETMFTQVPETIHEEFDYPIVSMWMKKEDGELHLRSLAGEQNRFSLDLLALAPRQVASTGKPIILTGSRGDLVDKLEISLPETGELQPNANGLDFTKNQSVAAVPLIRKRDFLGVLAVHSSQVNAFQKSDQMMLETLASQMVTTRDRIQLFESVEQEKQRMSAVLNAADDAILLIDAEDRLQLVNPAGKHLFTGIDAKTGYPLPKNAGYNKLIELLAEARQSNGSAQGELTCPDNHTFATLITPVENGGLVVVLHDVTHFKDLERIKNELIANTTHDLKNPINAVLGYGDLMSQAGPLTEMQKDFVSRIRRASMQMYELVLNLLEMARMDLDPELKLQPCDVRNLLTNVVSEFRIQAEEQQKTLNLIPLTSRPQVNMDLHRIRQTLRNLVGNAIKYTPPDGQITVSAQVQGRVIRIKVEDTGYGIPEDDLPFIFDKFYRVDMDETREIQGNGLGLAIVKSIVEQHGGQINVESTLGEGSCFSFSLPGLLEQEGNANKLT